MKGLKKSYIGRGHTDIYKWTLQLLERIGLEADDMKILCGTEPLKWKSINSLKGRGWPRARGWGWSGG